MDVYKERIEVIVKMQKTVGGVRSGRGRGLGWKCTKN